MPLQLKDYQKKAVGSGETRGALEAFFVRVRGMRDGTALAKAFNDARREAMGEDLRDLPYRPLAREGEGNATPQVCFRIPTGGGKTLLAAHAIERAARLYIGVSHPVVLWMVPTNIIRTQTRDALRAPGHPYHEALLEYWPADRLAVIDIEECEQLRAQDFGAKTIIVVCTMQTLRVDRTASRDVYAYKESFEPHFSALPEEAYFERIGEQDLEAQPYLRELLGVSAIGKVKYSFANLLAWHRPIVIVDEAHNHTTDLSYEVFRRIRPACVIEWTATPAKDQNVLYHVSAQELKAENMIKLPIVLAPHPNWREAVRDAYLTRAKLAEAAQAEPDYVRPIVLFQADQRDGEVTVEVLKQYLTAELHVDESRIAVATGTQRGLDGVDLFDRACAIEYVITVEALKEGWDCSFAYVFCTVQNIRSSKDMEQLLGRVLRLPYAKRRNAETLNRAYAHVCGPSTAAVANQLADRLVAMGFEELEAATFIETPGPDLFAAHPAIPASAPITQTTFAAPAAAVDALCTLLPQAAVVSGNEVTLTGILPADAIAQTLAAVPARDREPLKQQLERHQARALAAAAPAQRGIAFAALPRLAIPVQGELHLLEPALLGELAEINLAGAPADLPDFDKSDDARPYLIDMDGGQVRIAQDLSQYTLDLNTGESPIRREDLIRALDRRVRRDDVLQPDMVAWLGRVLDGLLARGIELPYIARHLNRVSEAIATRLDGLMASERKRVFQRGLLHGPSKARLSDHHGFRFDPHHYPARWSYNGKFVFRKHYYTLPGELQDDISQEETACAIELESLNEVAHWVRNLERQPAHSFWLPTSTDRFYPDFVAQLTDSRLFVVEYKGADRYSNEDSREKRDIGAVWAAASEGRCLFTMVTHPSVAGKSVSAQLRDALTT